MSGRIVYKKKHFIITSHGKDFIVQNLDYKHQFKHTHINNYHLGVLLIDTCLLGTIPKKANHLRYNSRFLESVIRICKKSDIEYFTKLKEELE